MSEIAKEGSKPREAFQNNTCVHSRQSLKEYGGERAWGCFRKEKNA